MKKMGIMALVLALTAACMLTGCMDRDMGLPMPENTPKVTAPAGPDATKAPVPSAQPPEDVLPSASPDMLPDMSPDPSASPQATTKPSEAN